MKTLKELRTELGLNQSDIAAKINISIPAYSLLENGQTVPVVEDMIILEKDLKQRLDWSPNEKVKPNAKQNILSAINTLSRNYPLISVLNFAQKYIKDDRAGNPDKIIQWYTGVAHLNDIRPLLPTGAGVKRSK